MNGKLLMDLAWSKAIEVYHPDVSRILRMSANPVQLTSGHGFAEGLLWHKNGYLIFSDLVKNTISKYTKQDEVAEVIMENSGLTGPPTPYHSHHIGSNAINYDLDGNLICCQHGNHAVVKLCRDGSVETLVDSYNGRRLNSPNDLAVGPDGSIYFTDPPYGLARQVLHPDIAQPVAGIYRWFQGTTTLLSKTLNYPNGICLSPDNNYLYVASNHEDEKMVLRYDILDGQLINEQLFVQENADGIRTDKNGNLFMATAAGVKIVSPEGVKLGLIKTDHMVTSVCIEGKTLYIATPHKIYKFALKNS